jgi:DegV family protein with EDD domain
MINSKETDMRTAIATDSNSGITQEQAEKLGIYVLPMPFMINGEMFYEGVNLTYEEFFRQMEEGADITTSQPSPGEVTDFWDKLLKEYDEILYIPMSSGLSGSCQTAIMLSDDYDGKVVNNQRISVTQEQSALDARDLAAKGYEAAQIKEILERVKYESSIYVTLTTLKYLKKGGRITPAAAALGTLLRIKPVLTIQGEKLDAFSKARTAKQARSIMLTALAKDLDERFHDKNAEHTYLEIAHTCNEEDAKELEAVLKEQYPGADITMAPLSLSIACHIGPGSLAVACSGKLKELE